MPIEATLSETDILTDVAEPNRPGLNREMAEDLLKLYFNEPAKVRAEEP